MIQFLLNEKTITTGLPAGTVLLDLIRYQQRLTGTKIGCREGDCGACTVLVGELRNGELHYQSMTSCLLPLGNIHGKHIVTIEGINLDRLNPIQQAMAEEGATQCGFCTPGFVMSLAGFCLGNKTPDPNNAIAAIDGNICRCTGYKSIERAAHKVAAIMQERKDEEPAIFVAKKKILPAYFSTIKAKLQSLGNGQVTAPNAVHTLVSGGTDLYVQKPDDLTNADIQFVFDQPALKGIKIEGDKCSIGASATVTDLLESPVINQLFPGFPAYAKLISSTPIRNMATVAGNFINASPIGDFTIFFLALDAQVVLSDLPPGHSTKEKSERAVPLRKLYKGYKTIDKKDNEYIERILFELPTKKTLFHFEKVSKRTHLDIATVNSAIRLEMNGDSIETAGISAGGVGPVPLFLARTSAFLEGKKVSEELVQQAIETARSEISPISDARGSKEYKTLLLGQLIKAHFITLFPKLEMELTHL